jgi:hypothetical protein
VLCGPWLDVADCELCSAEDFPEGRLQRALNAASELLYNATCRQFPGVCTDTIRPSMAMNGPFLNGADFPILADGSRWVPFGLGDLPGLVFGCGCGNFEFTGCKLHSVVYLPGVPVIEVTAVKVDGATVTDWTLVDNRALWKTGDGWWPCCSDPSLPDTDDDTFSIAYTYGAMPPDAGLLAVEVLACELARSWGSCDDCRLPRRLTSIVREGVSMAVLDPMQFFKDGMTGLYECDAFISQYDCAASSSRPATVLSASTWRDNPHRVAAP